MAVESVGKYRFISINQEFCNVTGLSQDQVVGKMVNEVIPEPSLTMVLGKYKQAIDEKRIIRWEETSVYPTGQLTGEVSLAPVFDDKSRCTNLVGSALDITDRKLAEVSLRVSEEKYRNLFENVKDVFYQIDLSGIINEVSPSIKHFSEFNREEILSTNVSGLYYNPADREILLNAIKKNGEVRDFELIFKTKSGEKRFASINARLISDANGKPNHIDGSLRDITERKRVDEELRESEKQYRDVIENTSDVILTTDINGNILFGNKTSLTITGYSLVDFTKMNYLELIHPEYRRKAQIFYMKQFKNKIQTSYFEYPLKNKSGDTIWLGQNANLIFENDQIKGFHLLARDITDRKCAEIALRESEEKYRVLLNGSTIGILAIDVETYQFAFSNPSIRKMFGYTEEEFKRLSLSNLHPKDSLDLVLSEFESQGRGEKSISLALPCLRKDGTIFYADIAGSLTIIDGRKCSVGFVMDITERIQASDALQRFQLLLKSSIECQKDTILFSIDRNYQYQYFNKAHSESMKYAYDKEVKIGMNILECITSDEDRKAAKENYDRALMGESHSNIRIFGDVNLAYYESFFNPIVNDNNEIIGATGLARNIAERKQAEEELILAKEKAEESDRLKSAFLANVSHEIRTPMNGILGFAELLKEPHLTGEEQQEYISIIEKSGARMLNIINDIVTISKIESGQMKISISATNINEQIQFIYAFFTPAAEKKGIQFSVKNTLPSEESIIKTDREKLYAVLTNLVNNATKYTHIGSIEFGVEKKGSYLEFFVKDTGMGIHQDQTEIIFERFRQGNDLNTRYTEGAGLGLSISKAYVEMLGGKIWVESEEGKGSIFYFTIPYNPESEAKTVRKKVPSGIRTDRSSERPENISR